MKKDPIQETLIQMRREQILDAASEVFSQRGFRAARIKEVAEVAGVSNGTIYNYFESKDALLMALLNRLNESDQRENQFAQAGAAGLRAFFEDYLAHRLSFLGERMSALQAVLPELLSNASLRERYAQEVIQPNFALAQEFFAMWQSARPETFQDQVDPALLVRTLAGAVFGMVLLRLFEDQELEERWDEIPKLLTDLCFSGLLHEPSSS